MSKDQLPDLLRQMVCRDNDELDIFWKAADEIERLRAQVAALREALVEISELPDSMAGATPSDYARGFVGGRYRAQMIARAALEEK